jgi:hypothetical protein
MTAEWRVRSFCFKRAQVIEPSISGIITSSMMTSGRRRSAIDSASFPLFGDEQAVPAPVERLIEDLQVGGCCRPQQDLWGIRFSGAHCSGCDRRRPCGGRVDQARHGVRF